LTAAPAACNTRVAKGYYIQAQYDLKQKYVSKCPKPEE
jgi:hypothetical protein